ncbi:hypothetical protein [Streptomyces sp. AK02-01A]|uniref:hypothetical protein n=1 Tax=Streptomyces sp. AK02-01A TaxID=3028648 RepID=UPI0029A6F9B9|nr:hypothetical protein [Streptomyces sp. AK02-01A]MDX3849161.1 hypothetical protein [Streptomyces sp. AK02-01A]
MRLRHALVIGATAVTTLAPVVLPAAPSLARASAAQMSPATSVPEAVPEAVAVRRQARAADAGRTALSGPVPGAQGRPKCGKTSARGFPIETRIHGGPAAYRPGGEAGNWYLDLTNTGAEACSDIHPVVVLTDRDRVLGTSQVKLEISDDERRWRTMSLEKSDEDEVIGVLDDGSPGFAVPAGRTVTVRARLAFAPGTRSNEIVVSAATVQRRGDDGDWVGVSNDYRFAVDGESKNGGAGGGPRTSAPSASPSATAGPAPAERSAPTESGTPDAASALPGAAGTPGDLGSATPTPTGAPAADGTGADSTAAEPAAERSGAAEEPAAEELAEEEPLDEEPAEEKPAAAEPGDVPKPRAVERASDDTTSRAAKPRELARTGFGDLMGRSAAAGFLVAAGAALFMGVRRLRGRRH